ncbi:hypothetical protein ACFQ1S_06745, partial [Kibdelosporangium lantanae]
SSTHTTDHLGHIRRRRAEEDPAEDPEHSQPPKTENQAIESSTIENHVIENHVIESRLTENHVTESQAPPNEPLTPPTPTTPAAPTRYDLDTATKGLDAPLAVVDLDSFDANARSWSWGGTAPGPLSIRTLSCSRRPCACEPLHWSPIWAEPHGLIHPRER